MACAWMGDSLGRKAAAEFLYNYIVKNDHIRVVNLNSPWGTGKTFFLDNWRRELEEKHICISFNAWENDFSVEPLVSLVSEINSQLKKYSKTSESQEKLVSLIAKTGHAIKAASPVIAKGLLLKIAGISADDVSESLKTGADASEQALTYLIENQESAEKTIKDFKLALSESIAKCRLENEEINGKAFFIIDELDRCRPTYAIELLERVKHFFDIEDCVFIIASDTEQLSHAVRSVYGEGFDSTRYLKRFFDSEFSLDNSDLYGLVDIKTKPLRGAIRDLNLSLKPRGMYDLDPGLGRVAPPDKNTFIMSGSVSNEAAFVTVLSKKFNTSLREIDKNIKQIISIRDNDPEGFDFIYASILVFMKDSTPDVYRQLVGGGVYVANPDSVLGELVEKNPINIIVEGERVSPIELFLVYYNALSATREELSRSINSDRGLKSAISYIVQAKKKYLEGLPKVVNLASSLK